jgi:hypothetical protein
VEITQPRANTGPPIEDVISMYLPAAHRTAARRYLKRRLVAIASLILIDTVTPIGASPAATYAGCSQNAGATACRPIGTRPRPPAVQHDGATGSPLGCPNIGNGIPGPACSDDPFDTRKPKPSIDLARRARHALTLPRMHIRWWFGRGFEHGLEINENAFAKVTKTVTDGQQTVTVQAAPACVYWDLDGDALEYAVNNQSDTVACRRHGPQPPHNRPARTSGITATMTWRIAWNCTGACTPANAHGTLDDLSTSSTAPPLK